MTGKKVDDRDKALGFTISQIEKQFGKGAIMKLGSREVIQVPAIPSGSLALDKALVHEALHEARAINGRHAY